MAKKPAPPPVRNPIKDEAKLAAWAAYEAITKQRAIDAKAKADEDALRKVLLTEAAAWQHARQIREYSTHVLSLSPSPQPKSMLDWESWAKGIADRLDPALDRFQALSQTE